MIQIMIWVFTLSLTSYVLFEKNEANNSAYLKVFVRILWHQSQEALNIVSGKQWSWNRYSPYYYYLIILLVGLWNQALSQMTLTDIKI